MSQILFTRLTRRETLSEIIAYFFILLFLYTGIYKIYSFSVFRIGLEESPLMPAKGAMVKLLAWGIAIMVPLLEIVISIMLFWPATRRKGLYGAAVLMALFSLYVGALVFLVPGSKQPCSCGGVYDNMNWNWHLGLNIAFTFLAMLGIKISRGRNYPL
jgi:putative oxidoreductase